MLLEISRVACATAPAVVPGSRSTTRMTALSSGVQLCPENAGSFDAWMSRPTARMRSASSNSRFS
ncbi:hypothetical protein [Pseudonocardia sp. HH130629-09]|uniref:hypothetical protein n=1 Tax=Pseudonocardia sp. HH130629-09 TaxID=1641402 RepID=UPI0006CB47B8|nr:hypothetical protein [Pseudonocardia sp. HH130629-09]ALE82286.1 hypothetical protein XF36_03315 [Pseudonocardia sp. HH130629-09]